MRGSFVRLWRRIAESFPERIALVDDTRRLTYAQFEEQSARLAGLLAERGIGSGDRVAFFLYNCPEYLIALNAVLKIRAVPVAINFRFRVRELSELVEDCSPAALVYPASLSPVVNGLDDAIRPGLLLEVDDGDSVIPDATPIASCPDSEVNTRTEDDSEGELMVYTGGTTGKPKAVVWDEADLFEIQLFTVFTSLGLAEPETADDVIAIAKSMKDPVVTLPLAPFMHATALFDAMNTLLLGGTVVISTGPSLDPAKAARLLDDEGVSRLVVAGDAVALPLLAALEETAALPLRKLTTVISSGMRFSDETKSRMHAIADLSVIDVLASTEGGPYAMSTSTCAEDLPAVFRLTPGATVFDEDMRDVRDRPGESGILGYCGALPRGYFGDEQKTRETYLTVNGRRCAVPGDYVRVLDDGYIELLGRGSAVVNTGGEKVFPAEVEEALLAHADVDDAVVFGVPDQLWGERVTAAVTLRTPDAATPEELIRFVKERLAGYKAPRQIVIRETLDRSPAGKLNLRSLKKEALGEETIEN